MKYTDHERIVRLEYLVVMLAGALDEKFNLKGALIESLAEIAKNWTVPPGLKKEMLNNKKN